MLYEHVCMVQTDQYAAVKLKKKKKRTSSTTTLFKIHWRRVILDEAHVIRNHKTALSIGACKLESGDYTVCVCVCVCVCEKETVGE